MSAPKVISHNTLDLSAVVVVEDGSADDCGQRFSVSGIDCAQFNQNPVLLYEYNENQQPIGFFDSPLWVEGDKLLGRLKLYPGLVGEDFHRLLLAGDLIPGIAGAFLRREGDVFTKCKLRGVSLIRSGRVGAEFPLLPPGPLLCSHCGPVLADANAKVDDKPVCLRCYAMHLEAKLRDAKALLAEHQFCASDDGTRGGSCPECGGCQAHDATCKISKALS
jgi:hypothetical protein